MLFSTAAQLSKRKDADILVIPFWQRSNRPKSAAASLGVLEKQIQLPLEMKDFSGKEGETFFFYLNGEKEKRCLLLGLGVEEKLSVEGLRKAYSSAAKFCQKKSITKLNVLLPNIVELRRISVEESLKGICEGFLLTNYRWSQKTQKKEEESNGLLKSISLIGILPKMQPLLEQFVLVAEAVYFARDLINGNADIVTPQYLVESTRKLSERFPSLKATIFDKKRIEKEKMGLLLAVARGSPHDPAFIILNYQGNTRSKDHSVIIGKGVTFDTGGLNLKPTGSMETMRDDMSGAACVLGTMAAIASLGLKVNVTAVVAAAENAIDGNSYKPGDVYKSYSGKTVEIGNTDAEGRLTLADAISYSVKHLKPTRLIDLATLTGAMVIALGEGVSGVMSNDETLCKQLLDASQLSSELIWRLPLHAPYKDLIKSDIADIKNTGGRPGGAITAALFLEEFVEAIPWAHIDIAGTAFGSKESYYLPKNGIGFGIRLLIEFFQKLAKG